VSAAVAVFVAVFGAVAVADTVALAFAISIVVASAWIPAARFFTVEYIDNVFSAVINDRH
jgi:hypothetical protein